MITWTCTSENKPAFKTGFLVDNIYQICVCKHRMYNDYCVVEKQV